jgi:CRISPR type III-A-associated protein Csm2
MNHLSHLMNGRNLDPADTAAEQVRAPLDHPSFPRINLPRRYFDDKGHLLRSVFIDWPEAIREALVRAKPPATKNSLRGFYSMLRMAKREFDFDWQRNKKEDAWGNAKTDLYRLRTAAKYQGERKVISPLCRTFLETNIDAVIEEGTGPENFEKYFNAFVEHFQAVIAYLPERKES